MSKLEYNQSQELVIDGVRLKQIIGDGFKAGFYYYSLPALKQRIEIFKQQLSTLLQQKISIHFAMKANPNTHILNCMKSQGLGVDIVSGGELAHALKNGFAADKIVFSGVAKTHAEIEQAIDAGVAQFNVESPSELRRIKKISEQKNKTAQIVLRINPNVDAKTHPYIATGIAENKFGLNESQYQECLEVLKSTKALKYRGISCHIGSQILDVSVFRQSLHFQKQVFQKAIEQGNQLDVFNIGGGLGINYAEDSETDIVRLKNYTNLLAEELKNINATIQFEPGRFLVARCGYLLTQIEYLKNTTEKNFILCNSGMNHLLRPALYGAKHRIFSVQKRPGQQKNYDVVGPVCESSDFLGKDIMLSPSEEGDWLCVCDAGAYGASMASQYNLFALPEEKIN